MKEFHEPCMVFTCPLHLNKTFLRLKCNIWGENQCSKLTLHTNGHTNGLFLWLMVSFLNQVNKYISGKLNNLAAKAQSYTICLKITQKDDVFMSAFCYASVKHEQKTQMMTN